jgi:hypothetical protein|tara:strand:+ start:69 stop:455 length:387 start_codon:yes stop_codon:yes gene_type:complete
MANQYKGEIKGKLGDKERTFRLTFESIVNIENRTSKSIMVVAQELATNKFSFQTVLIVLHEALQGAGGKFVQSAVGDMIMKTNLINSAVLCGNVLATIFVDNDEENKDSDSPLELGENEQQNTQSSNT